MYHALYGTLVQAGVATVLSVPLGLMTAVYLVEYGSRSAGARDDLHGRRASRGALDRGGAIRVQLVDRHPRVSAVRLCGVVGTGLADVAGGGAVRRGNAEVGARRAARSQLRVGCSQMDDHRADRLSDRDAGHRRRCVVVDRSRHRRNRAGAGAGRVQPLHQPRHLQRQHGVAAAADLHRTHQPRARRFPAGMGRGANPDHHRGRHQPHRRRGEIR